MKVLQMCVRFPPAPGGAENHVHEISKELKARGESVKVFTSDLYTEMPLKKLDAPYTRVDGISVKRFPTFSMPGDMHYVIMKGMLGAAIRSKPDIMHAHSYGYYQMNVAAAAKKLKGTPLVLTTHYHPEWSMWGGDKRKQLRKIYDRFLSRTVLNSADVIIGVSRHEMELMSRLGFDTSKVRVIPNGIVFSRFDPIPDGSLFRKEYGVEGRMVLYTGRLASNKGLHVLIRSAPQVLKEYPDTTFVIGGEDFGIKNQLISQARKLGIEKNIIFTGHIKDEEMFRSAYAACDAYVLPSEFEAFGIVLLEAMACEKPCIGTRVGGVPEVIEDGKTGFLVEYEDSKALSEKL
ncbi:MAG: glycosyltransferase family 4 protein, partial [Candidatus Thermoplasmatota archaeon]|nr:glycosyltransferase family 4 protein [Candidatus Thermoplasmatota archaeon]